MITLTLSEAFAYDLLAGAAVKLRHNPSSAEAKENLISIHHEIREQVGVTLHEQVCSSIEYQTLMCILDDIYVRNDEIKARPITADDMAYTDGKVGERWHAKRALQTKWFPGSPLTEQKFGYGGAK